MCEGGHGAGGKGSKRGGRGGGGGCYRRRHGVCWRNVPSPLPARSRPAQQRWCLCVVWRLSSFPFSAAHVVPARPLLSRDFRSGSIRQLLAPLYAHGQKSLLTCVHAYLDIPPSPICHRAGDLLHRCMGNVPRWIVEEQRADGSKLWSYASSHRALVQVFYDSCA